MDAVHDDSQERRYFWFLMIAALVVIGAGIGLRDPWPSDEPRFTLVARQMFESGDWLFPRRGIELYADKPPMLMWLEAGFYTLLRSWRVAFLLPSLLASVGTIALVYDLGRRLWTRQAGLYAGAALLVTFQFAYQTKRAQIDPLVMFFITLGNYGLLRHFLRGPDWRAFWLGCFAAGLGVITKGVGILSLFLFIPYVVALVARFDGVTLVRGHVGHWLLGPVAFLLAIALWLVPMLLTAQAHSSDPAYAAYVNDILFQQTAKRYANSWDHGQSVFYFLPVIIGTWLPLSLTYFGTFPRWWAKLKARDARYLLPLGWIVLVLIFFSIPHGKRDVYVMPALPMLALVTAPLLDELLGKPWLRRLGLATLTVIGAALVAGGVLALTTHPKFAVNFIEQRGLEQGDTSIWWMAITIGVIQLALVATMRMKRAVTAVVAGMVSLWLVFSLWGYPALNASSSSVEVMQRTRELVPQDDQLAMAGWKEQNMLMYPGHATDFGFTVPWNEQFAAAAAWLQQDPDRRWVFIQDAVMGNCVDVAKATFVGTANRRGWYLIRAGSLVPGCKPGEDVNENGASGDS
ncbi:4-amino-4-deoxy-L-arabinose transferase-like glycosyltransferase [Luteibacter rhizovicinus]|uniref:4-amino-4-deoxy-L-arabinose transferase-like glycosyltransferase n=1 Tax=Luteibacter rhizovicinus TaxID=242606 RepID=A0A4R3YUZ8_9GAMM|nr:glycosyltransferase family 39 protein [Luteibacter rhizovicinus]TCV96312.1 4-amino-4-deoxy-L-arabinose transferase-like glycosyltransferase [Luteibacter rhizovicinus]